MSVINVGRDVSSGIDALQSSGHCLKRVDSVFYGLRRYVQSRSGAGRGHYVLKVILPYKRRIHVNVALWGDQHGLDAAGGDGIFPGIYVGLFLYRIADGVLYLFAKHGAELIVNVHDGRGAGLSVVGAEEFFLGLEIRFHRAVIIEMFGRKIRKPPSIIPASGNTFLLSRMGRNLHDAMRYAA